MGGRGRAAPWPFAYRPPTLAHAARKKPTEVVGAPDCLLLVAAYIPLWVTLAKSSFDLRAWKSGTLLAQGGSMHFGRIILILLIAVSVAMLPTGSGGALGVKTVDMSHMSSVEHMDDCCPDKKLPSRKTIDDCCSSMTCPMSCFSFLGASSSIVYPLLLGSVTMSLVSNPVHSQKGSPPFRPPRI
jgi:hypothetical protein